MTYVLSDLHGLIRAYHNMLEQIRFSPSDELYILGDLPDRNPDGIEIIKETMNQTNIHILLGNHEYMMLNTLTINPHDSPAWERYYSHWQRNGGEVTYQAFCKETEEMQQKIIRFLQSLPLQFKLNVNGKRILLVHSAPISLYRQNPNRYSWKYESITEFAVWERIMPYDIIDIPQDLMICGHTPTKYIHETIPMEVYKKGKIMWIDCGCACGFEKGGRLACVCLETEQVFYEDAM